MSLTLRELKSGIRWSCCFKSMEQSIAILINTAFKRIAISTNEQKTVMSMLRGILFVNTGIKMLEFMQDKAS